MEKVCLDTVTVKVKVFLLTVWILPKWTSLKTRSKLFQLFNNTIMIWLENLVVFLDVINAPIIAAWSSFRLLLPIITNYRILLKKKQECLQLLYQKDFVVWLQNMVCLQQNNLIISSHWQWYGLQDRVIGHAIGRATLTAY